MPSSQQFRQPMTGVKGFGYSFSYNVKDMDGDGTPEFAIGAVSNEGENVALLVRTRPTIYIKPMSKPSSCNNYPGVIDGSGVIDPQNTGNDQYHL